MRLIDADALINTLEELFDKRDKEARFTGDRGVTVTWNDAIYHIKTAPTIEERIVRCKDCKFGTDWDGRLGCEWHGFYKTEPNWFCADGERKDDE